MAYCFAALQNKTFLSEGSVGHVPNRWSVIWRDNDRIQPIRV